MLDTLRARLRATENILTQLRAQYHAGLLDVGRWTQLQSTYGTQAEELRGVIRRIERGELGVALPAFLYEELPAAPSPIIKTYEPPPKPLELALTFTAADADAPIKVAVACRDLGIDTAPLPFVPPLGKTELADIRWYLEEYWSWPVGPDYERAKRLEANLEPWGRKLFGAVFDHADARDAYRQFEREDAPARMLTIDAVDARVLRLPWELLADEDGHLFSFAPPIVVRRKLRRVKARRARARDGFPIRILFVTSRPKGAGFIDSRVSAVALLDAVDALGGLVEVEFLRPPTLKSLTARVRDKSRPPVHVVHFDGHGVYDTHAGLGLLLFETERHEVDKVNAHRIGALLNQQGIPLMVLDACQSAQVGAGEPASVAARLIKAGVGSVLAMNYSVLVETARRLTAAFYTALAGGATIGQAVEQARYDLLADTERIDLHRPEEIERIHLHDWFLPALYQQEEDVVLFATSHPHPLPLREAYSQEYSLKGRGESSPSPLWGEGRGEGEGIHSSDPLPTPQYGFVGRARDILRLERALQTHRVVVLHGYGGMGKTALALEAGRWFVRTGLFAGAIFVSMERGMAQDTLLAEVARNLAHVAAPTRGAAEGVAEGAVEGAAGDAADDDCRRPRGGGLGGGLGERLREYNPHAADAAEVLAGALREFPALLILDNFESVLPSGDAELPRDELRGLLETIRTLVWNWNRRHEGGGIRRDGIGDRRDGIRRGGIGDRRGGIWNFGRPSL